MSWLLDSSMDGDFAVALSSCLVIATGVPYSVMKSAELETWMTSVERILEYGQLENEESHSATLLKPRKTWPESGKIEFKDVSLNYDQGGKSALSRVSFCAQAGEKVTNI